MKKMMTFGVLLSLTTAFGGGFGKTKYIAFGWDIGRAEPRQILKMMPKLEQTAFDGVAVGCEAIDGKVSFDSGYIMNDPEWRYESFAGLVGVYRAINSHGRLKDNFLAGGMSARRTEKHPDRDAVRASLGGQSPRIAYDDDAAWARIAHNYGVLAKIAKEGGFSGICLDNEDYHGTKQFDYDPATDGEYKVAWRKLRQRGREVFGAVFREFPDVKLAFFWAMSNVRNQLHAADPLAEIRKSGRLFSAFLNGLLDVMPPEAVVIDFDEDAYTFRAASGAFEKTYIDIMGNALAAIAPENRAKYRAQFRNSYLLYLDQYVGSKFRTRAGKRGVPNNWYRPPVNGSRAGGFLADLEAASGAVDGYVGIYGERFGYIDWEHELDGTMQLWNSFNSRVTWDEELGLDAKIRLCKEPQEYLRKKLAEFAGNEGSTRGTSAGENLLAGMAKPKNNIYLVEQGIGNRDYYAVSCEKRGGGAPVARWQRGTDWNWEPAGTRHVEFTAEGAAKDGWTNYIALIRVPEGATRVQLQLGEGEVRNAAMYRLDPVPSHGFHLAYQMDLGRIAAPPMEDLKGRVDKLAALGFDQFQLYMECSFAYRGHETAWSGRRTLTAAEMKELYAYARAKGVELVPSQNSFAHLGMWFQKKEYLKLAECPNGAVMDCPKIRKKRGPVTLIASGAESLKFLAGLYDQLLPCCPGRYLNIGCDEVYDLWDVNCRSAERIRKEGYARVYWNHVLDVAKLAYQRQRDSMFWADAIFEYPELQREIGRNMIALVYGYTPGGSDKFDGKCASLSEHEVRFYVCPGTQSWKQDLPAGERLAKAKANISEAFEAARKHGAEGVLVCDWGDGGYQQPLEVSLPALEFAAECFASGR